MSDVEKFKKIIPTAILTAYPRTFTDIPLYPEIFAKMQELSGSINEDLLIAKLAPELEARHKIIDKLLAESTITQVIEIASGFSPRGLNFATSNPESQYIEIDLPEVAEAKRKILAWVTEVPNNLHIISGNVLDEEVFTAATESLDPKKPVAIVNEGLLRYLTFDEKAELAENISQVLRKFGGVWITGDGATKEFRDSQNQNIKSMNETILTQTKRNNLGNAFDSQEQMTDFFGELGLSTEFHSYAEVQDQLVSPQKLNLTDDEVREKLLKYASAIMLRLKKR